jgi:hypothetical protein
MNPFTWSPRLVVACCALPLITMSTPAGAQTDRPGNASGPPWTLVGAIGYGGVGFGAGALLTWNMPSDNFVGPSDRALAIVAATTALGTLSGAIIGSTARRRHGRNERLSTGQQIAVVAGSVLAGATLGALAAVPLISSDGEGTPLGTDETTFGILTAGGGALGVLYAVSQRHWIGGSRVEINQGFRGLRQYELRAQLRF